MKIFDRILLTIYSFFIGALALLLILVPFSQLANGWTSNLYRLYYSSWQNIFIPMFFLAMSIRFLISGFKRRSFKSKSIVRHTNYGEINISVQALESMAHRSAKLVPGLKEIRAIVESLEEGMLVHVEALAMSDINIPEVSIKIQQDIKQYIEDYTGITVKEVKVKINDIAGNSKARVE